MPEWREVSHLVDVTAVSKHLYSTKCGVALAAKPMREAGLNNMAAML